MATRDLKCGDALRRFKADGGDKSLHEGEGQVQVRVRKVRVRVWYSARWGERVSLSGYMVWQDAMREKENKSL